MAAATPYVFDTSGPTTITCCICGSEAPVNPSNRCVSCLRAEIDITEDIPKNLAVTMCKSCGRFLVPPKAWVVANLESRELLSLCLKRIKGLNRVKLVDASFVWTEPHSRRIKVQLTIQKEVLSGTILQQVFVVEFVVHTNQCPNCAQAFAGDALGWTAVLQLRQRVDHKRTFFFLEQMILKHNAHQNTLNIKEMPEGLDFYFASKNHAAKFASFISQVSPVRTHDSKKLVSHDEQSNVYRYKFTLVCEIVPVCREDLVFLDHKTANTLGAMSRLCLVSKVSNMIHLLDPLTLNIHEVTVQQYWKTPFSSIGARGQLIEFVVLDVELLGPRTKKYALADVTLARSSDFGVNDVQYTSRTHLGTLLQPGDLALGYDIQRINGVDFGDDFDAATLQDIVLVRKAFPAAVKRASKRKWKLKKLEVEELEKRAKEEEKKNQDYEMFLRDVEEDKEFREGMKIYRDPSAPDRMVDDDGDEDMDGEDDGEGIGLEEMLDDMNLEDEDGEVFDGDDLPEEEEN